MSKLILAVVGLYVVALHGSMAGMEIFAWLGFLAAVFVVLREKAYPGLNGATISWLALGAMVLLSQLLTTDEFRNWHHFAFMRWILVGIVYSYLLQRVLTDRRIQKGAYLWLGCSVFVGLYATFQALTGIDLFHSGRNVTSVGSMWRATGLFSDSITFASVIGMSSAMCWGWAFAGPVNQRHLALLSGSMGSLAVMFSLSRASFCAILLVILLAVLLTRPKRQVFFTMSGLGLASIAVFVSFESVRLRMSSLLALGNDHSMGMRLHLWQAYRDIFVDHPWFGVGLFSAQKLVPEYYRRLGIEESFVSHAHSNWLQWLAGAGLFAFLIYLFISILMLKYSYELFRYGRELSYKGLGLATLLAQVVFQVNGFIECNFFDGEVNHQIVFLWALVIAARVNFKQKL